MAVINSNVNIIGAIGEDVIAQTIRDELKAAGDEVAIYIDSPGGDVIESNAISLAIAEYALANPGKTYTCIIGSLCASAAANILAKLPTAFSVKAYKDSLIMFHSCSGIVEGGPEQLKDFSMMMELVNENVIRELSSKTSLGIAEIKGAFSAGRELWLDAYKAKDVGLVDEIIGEAPALMKYTENASTAKVLALVAKYKSEANAMAKAEIEVEKQETDPVIAEVEVEENPVADEAAEVEKEALEEAIEKELEEKPEVDIDAIKAECDELKAENEQLKTEIEGLKALIAKYRPAAKASTKPAVKADWLTMVKELNAKHLGSAEYDKAYVKLKAEHKAAFDDFMKNHSIR